MAVFLFIVIFIVIEVALVRPENLISLFGYFVYIFLLFVLSAHPAMVRLMPVKFLACTRSYIHCARRGLDKNIVSVR